MSDIIEQISINKDNESSISMSNKSSSINFIPNSVIRYPNIIYSLIFFFAETPLAKYFEEKEDFISQGCKKNERYLCNKSFVNFLKALKNLKEKDFQSYNINIKNIITKYQEEEKDIKGESDLLSINVFIFDKIIFELIKSIIKIEKEIDPIPKELIQSKGKGDTMEKAIKEYKKNFKKYFEGVKQFVNLFCTKFIRFSNKNGEKLYKMHEKEFHSYIIKQKPENIKKNSIEDYFDTKKTDIIYQFPEFLIFLFEIDKDNYIDYTIKYDKEISLPYFDGEKKNYEYFSLNAIIYEDEDKDNDIHYNIMIKNPQKEKEWKIFNGNEVKEVNLSDELCYEKKGSFFMLFYKKELK